MFELKVDCKCCITCFQRVQRNRLLIGGRAPRPLLSTRLYFRLSVVRAINSIQWLLELFCFGVFCLLAGWEISPDDTFALSNYLAGFQPREPRRINKC